MATSSALSSLYFNIVQTLLSEADIIINGNRPHDIQVHDEKFYQRFVKDGRLGLGESYMEGWWDCAQLDEMFFKLFRTDSKLQLQTRNWKFLLAHLKSKLIPDGSIRRSSNVGEKHYDLDNELFSVMLDKRMQYTCGLWDNAKNLDEAQEAKLELICRKLKLQPGMTLLDIGCGFGGLAKYAAEKYGVKVVGISISKEQLVIGRERCAGLPVELRFQDYREVTEKFDRIVCIEMFEHVGLEYYKEYFSKVRECIKDDGIFLMQIGGINISPFTNIWIKKYVFPGVYIPTLAEIFPMTEKRFVLEHLSVDMGPSYYHTLMAWHKNFTENWDKFKHKYDEQFYRVWVYYLLSCAAGFRSRRGQVWQLVFTPQGMVGGYHY